MFHWQHHDLTLGFVPFARAMAEAEARRKAAEAKRNEAREARYMSSSSTLPPLVAAML